MRSLLNLSALFSLLTLPFFLTSCEKDDIASDSNLSLSPRNAHSFVYSVNPAMTGEPVTVTFDAGNGADCGKIHIQAVDPDGEAYGGQPSTPEAGVADFTFVPLVPGEYVVRAKYTRTGKPSDCDYESTGWLEAEEILLVEGDTLGEEEEPACDGEFTAEIVLCDSLREVVFTYIPDRDYNNARIQGGLTNFTEGDAVVTVTGADLDIEQRTPGNSSNRIITLTGSVVGCEPITITVSWASTNEDPVITGDWSATGGFVVEELECP